MKSPVVSVFLAVVHGLAGLAILIVSSWFIAACAVAGPQFNYMIPAVVIRALALLRIASGYAHMWTGHHHLLNLTARLRLHLFNRLKDTLLTTRADGVEALAKHTEAVAAVWVGWVSQQASAIVMLLISLIALWIMNIPGYWGVLGLAVSWLSLSIWLVLKGLHCALAQVEAETDFRFASEHFLNGSSLWHLYQTNDAMPPPDAEQVWYYESQQQHLGLSINWLLQGAAWLLLILGLMMASQHSLGDPLFLVVPMLLLSAGDWLGRSTLTQPALNDYQRGKDALHNMPITSLMPQPKIPITRDLSIEELQPKGYLTAPITHRFSHSGLVLLKGESGSGKSSLLKGIAGLLATNGKRLVDGKELPQGLVEGWLYLEQQPVILAANLRDNLRIAADVSDDILLAILGQVGLAYLTELGTWLGPSGRNLSGGEAKRLSVARALLAEGNVWLVDEPFEGLDHDSCQFLIELFNQLARTKLIIVASHVYPDNLRYEQVIELK
jgi:ATP-binding cassette subfamily C protein CydC